jgi:hypothetical protein
MIGNIDVGRKVYLTVIGNGAWERCRQKLSYSGQSITKGLIVEDDINFEGLKNRIADKCILLSSMWCMLAIFGSGEPFYV